MTQQLNQDFMIQIKDMNKWYGEFHVLKNIQPECQKRRTYRHLWTIRLRKINHDPLH